MARVAETFGATVNEVLPAAISGGFRELLVASGEEPAADSMRSLVPVSVRAAGEAAVDNEVSPLLPLLPVDLADLVQRLVRVHCRLRALKDGKEAAAGAFVTATAARGPFAPAAWALRAAVRLTQRIVVTVTIPVPGPTGPLTIAGREMTALYPYVPIALGLRTGIAMLTCRGRVFYGVTTDRATVPDPRVLDHAIAAGLDELKAAAVFLGQGGDQGAGIGQEAPGPVGDHRPGGVRTRATPRCVPAGRPVNVAPPGGGRRADDRRTGPRATSALPSP